MTGRKRQTTQNRPRISEKSRIRFRGKAQLRKTERQDSYDEIDYSFNDALPTGQLKSMERLDDQDWFEFDAVLGSESIDDAMATTSTVSLEKNDSFLIDDDLLRREVCFQIHQLENGALAVECLKETHSKSKAMAYEEMKQLVLCSLEPLSNQFSDFSSIPNSKLLLILHRHAVNQVKTELGGLNAVIPKFKLSDRTKRLFESKFARLPCGRVFSIGLLIANSKAESFSKIPDAIIIQALASVFEEETNGQRVFDDIEFCGRLRKSLANILEVDVFRKNPSTSDLQNLQRRLNGRSKGRNLFPIKQERKRKLAATNH